MTENDLIRGYHVRFDVLPGDRVKIAHMRWPSATELSEPDLSGNRDYVDLRGITREQAQDLLKLEDESLKFIESRGNELSLEEITAVWRKFQDASSGLDLGVGAAVFAISATGGIPVSSCNGNAICSGHYEDLPNVAFFWPRGRLKLLREVAADTGMSLWNHRHGELVLGADYIRRFLRFAETLLARTA